MSNTSELQAAIFRVGEEYFALDIRHIREITRMEDITRVPRMPQFVEGVMDLRGQIIPVVDLRKRLDAPVDRLKQTRILITVVEHNLLGLIVDAVTDVWEIAESEIDDPPAVGSAYRADFLQGIVHRDKQIIFFLNFEALLSNEEKARVGKVSGSRKKGKS